MRPRTADLILRPRRPADDGFLYQLSDRLFAAYAWSPSRAMDNMSGEPGAEVRVAEREGAQVGFFVVAIERLGRAFGPWQRPAIARLNAIGVRPDAQGAGVGRYLLASAEDLGRERGAVSMTLMTAETNHRARALFESAGFLRVLTLEQAYARGQRGLVMNKAL